MLRVVRILYVVGVGDCIETNTPAEQETRTQELNGAGVKQDAKGDFVLSQQEEEGVEMTMTTAQQQAVTVKLKSKMIRVARKRKATSIMTRRINTEEQSKVQALVGSSKRGMKARKKNEEGIVE